MRACDFLGDDFAQPLGAVAKLACACATKRSAKRKPLPKLSARQNAVQARKPIKPKSPVKPVASHHNNIRK
jgi:hypothetical protein